MSVVLQSGVQTGIINASGVAITLGGLLLTFFWLNHLYR